MPSEELITELPRVNTALLLSNSFKFYHRIYAIAKMTRTGPDDFDFCYYENDAVSDAQTHFFLPMSVTNPRLLGIHAKDTLRERIIKPKRGDFSRWMIRYGIDPEYAIHLYHNDILTLACHMGIKQDKDNYSMVDTLKGYNHTIPFEYIFDIEEYDNGSAFIKKNHLEESHEVHHEICEGDTVWLQRKEYQYSFPTIECHFGKNLVGFINRFQVGGFSDILKASKTDYIFGTVNRVNNKLPIPRLWVKVKFTFNPVRMIMEQ